MKKGGIGVYNVKAGKVDVTLVEDALEISEFVDINNEHDGFGALTGAIDQLAFTCDLDFSGDGLEDTNTISSSRRPEIASAEIANKKLLKADDKHEKNQKNKRKEIDNAAFIEDEEFLLAATISQEPDQDNDSDDNDELKVKTPKVIVRDSIFTDHNLSKDPKRGVVLPPLKETKYRPSSVKLRRLGSACRKAPCYGMTFTENTSPISNDTKCTTKTNCSSKPKMSKKKCKTEEKAKTEINLANEDNVNISTPEQEKTNESFEPEKFSDISKNSNEEENSKLSESEEFKWADKKNLKKNKVSPLSSSCEEPKEKRGYSDDSIVGLQSGTDSTREEVKAKEKKERPKTAAATKGKMKSWSNESVQDMKNILPWSNEDGDIGT